MFQRACRVIKNSFQATPYCLPDISQLPTQEVIKCLTGRNFVVRLMIHWKNTHLDKIEDADSITDDDHILFRQPEKIRCICQITMQ